MRIYPSDDLLLHDCQLSSLFLNSLKLNHNQISYVCMERECGKICLTVSYNPRVRESHVSFNQSLNIVL